MPIGRPTTHPPFFSIFHGPRHALEKLSMSPPSPISSTPPHSLSASESRTVADTKYFLQKSLGAIHEKDLCESSYLDVGIVIAHLPGGSSKQRGSRFNCRLRMLLPQNGEAWWRRAPMLTRTLCASAIDWKSCAHKAMTACFLLGCRDEIRGVPKPFCQRTPAPTSLSFLCQGTTCSYAESWKCVSLYFSREKKKWKKHFSPKEEFGC